MFKKFIGILSACLCVCLVLSTVPQRIYAVETSASAAVVIEKESGRVLFAKNADWELPMASTTKIMTAYIAIKYGTLSDVVTVSENAASTEGSSMYLEVGEQITIENLVYGLMLLSGNDAAVALAEAVGGSVERFVEMMNETAADMGLEHTHFDNPNGLPSDTHYTTAAELAEITRIALDDPTFAAVVQTASYTIPWYGHDYNREMTNHNKLLSTLEGCVGVKTGYTEAAGRCLVSAVTRDDMTLICVTLNDPNDWADHTDLHNEMFEKYHMTYLTSTDKVVDKIVVGGGLLGYAGLSADKAYLFPISSDDVIKVDTEVYDELSFPIAKGDIVGSGTVTVNGESYGSFNLVSNDDISLKEPSRDSFKDDLSLNFTYIVDYWAEILNKLVKIFHD